MATWDSKSFVDSRGNERLKRFINAAPELGIKIDPEFLKVAKDELAKGRLKPTAWEATLRKLDPDNPELFNQGEFITRGNKNFNSAASQFISDMEGNPVDLKDYEHVARGHSTLNTTGKEYCFMYALLFFTRNKSASIEDFVQYMKESIQNEINLFKEFDIKTMAQDIAGFRKQATCAQQALKVFNESYQIFHNTHPLIKKLRDYAISLYPEKLAPDRWNPADVYLVQNPADIHKLCSIQDFKNLNLQFNILVQQHKLIPISLKDADTAATGSTTLGTLSTFKGKFAGTWTTRTSKSFEEALRSCVAKLNQEGSKTGFAGALVSASQRNAAFKTTATSVHELLNSTEFKSFVNSARSGTWRQTYPEVVRAFLKTKNLFQKLQDLILFAYSKSLDVSTDFYLCTPSKCVHTETKSAAVHIKFINFILNIVSVKVFYTVTFLENGKLETHDTYCEIRSKGKGMSVINTYLAAPKDSSVALKI